MSPVRPACAVRVTSRGRGAVRRRRCPPQGRQVRPYRRRCPPQPRKPRPYLRTCLPQEQQKPRPHPPTHLPHESTRSPAHPSTRRPGQASSWWRRTSHGSVFVPHRPGSSAGAAPPVRPPSPRTAWRGGRRARSPSARHHRCSTGATWTRSYATAQRGRRSCDRSAPSTDAAAPQTPLSLSPPCSPVRSAAPGQRSGESSFPQVSAHFGVLLSLIVPDPPATERTPRRLHSGCEQHHETEDAVRTWGLGGWGAWGPGDLEADTCPRRCSSAMGPHGSTPDIQRVSRPRIHVSRPWRPIAVLFAPRTNPQCPEGGSKQPVSMNGPLVLTS